MKINFNTHDGMLVFAANHRKGTWGNSILLRGGRTIRSGGQLPTCATAHTLLVVAMTAALRNISHADVSRLMQFAPDSAKKPRLMLRCADSTFFDALQGIMSREPSAFKTPRLRVGKNFLLMLARQLVRFDLTFSTAAQIDTDAKDCLILKNWMDRTVQDAKAVAEIPAVLLPTAVTTIEKAEYVA